MTSSVKFSEIAELVMGQSPKGADCNETGDGFPLLNGPTEFTERSPLPVQFTTAGKKFSKTGDILFCVRGSTTGRMNYADQAYAIGRGIGAIRGINGYPTAYIRAVLEHNLDRLLVAATGSTFPNVGKDLLNNFEVNVCSPEQAQQANKLLVGIEDKRYLNSQTNQTLEEMAQAIFKSWFVDFDPVKAKINGDKPEGMDEATASLFPDKLVESALGLIPEGWAVNQLSDICKNHSQSYDLKSVDEVVFVNTGDVLEGDFLHKDYSSVEGLPGQAKKAIKEDDILYSEIRPKNKRYAYVDFDVSDYVVSTKFMVIQANEKVHPRLLYMMLTRQNTIDEFNVIADSRSGTFPQITFKAISNLEFCMAPREVQDAFVAQVMPMIKLQRSLKTENKQLADLRDTLLPKLLSGEIELGLNEAVELEA
ncbi:restriction endonuclease subunit S [Vibrio parahaemolyticus]|nr:restriction endonuclease subunit S [Vibrio parahaemolyticus]ELA7417119.1 restriction endonuclease subunit S [Vibrio parahaemolyticus]